MKTLSSNLVEKIKSEMKGKKLEKFLESVRILNESAANGAWIQGGKRRADSGFYQGSGIQRPFASLEKSNWDKYYKISDYRSCIEYGNARGEVSLKGMKAALKEVDPDSMKKFSKEYLEAWVELCIEKKVLVDQLEVARPKPVLTSINLSPKVTATLKECNLDLDLSTITYPELETFTMEVFVKVKNQKTGEFEGKWVEQEFQRPIWPKGTLHNQSRFSMNTNGCHACGKNIPSGRFVPFYAFDNKKKTNVSMWVGCDCGKNIFGIKDVGVARLENLKTKKA